MTSSFRLFESLAPVQKSRLGIKTLKSYREFAVRKDVILVEKIRPRKEEHQGETYSSVTLYLAVVLDRDWTRLERDWICEYRSCIGLGSSIRVLMERLVFM